MCLYINKGESLLIAEEDIPVFKIAKYQNDKILSYYQDFEYNLGIEYKTKLGEPKGQDGYPIQSICEGFHSYLGSYHITRAGDIYYIDIYSKERGIDVYRVVPDHETCVKLNCIIPKGSEYYISCNKGEYVSNKLKVIDFEIIK